MIDVRSKLKFWLGHLEGAIGVQVDTISTRMAERDCVPLRPAIRPFSIRDNITWN